MENQLKYADLADIFAGLARLDVDDLRAVNAAAVARIRHANALARFNFSVGDRVKFTDRRTGTDHDGFVVKIGRSKVQVKTATTRWVCSPTLLRRSAAMADVRDNKQSWDDAAR